MRPVEGSKTPITSTTDFVKRYTVLLEKIRSADAPMNPYKFTFCAMDAKLMKKSGLMKIVKRRAKKMENVVH